MTQRIIIRHISGTRLHQTDEFQTDGMRAITAGRSDSANIQLDSQREDMVSREHLRITPQTPGSDIFLLTDLNSRNGTFLNRLRISQSSSIRHNDVVQLGPDGPEFRFELDPPPMSAVKPTRFVDGAQQAALSRMTPTREVALGGPQARPIGRATVERMLGDTFGKVKKESNKTLWIGIAALVLIIVVGATTLMALRSSRMPAV
jgi:serine protease Do